MTSKTGYKNLEIYQLAHELGITLHHFSLKLPKYELYETGSQLRRASKSISANIAEGYGRRRYKAEWVKFLVYALASCDETTEWLQYISDCYPQYKSEVKQIFNRIDELGQKLNRFIQSIEINHISVK
jgi:four helix bundle protein